LPKLRVGIGDVLDARPLAWGLLKGHHADLFAPVVEPLPLVGRMLAQGDLEVGLVPVIDAALAPSPVPAPAAGSPPDPRSERPPGLLALPDLCVAFPGEARSVVLVSASPLPEVRRVFLGRSARTAAAVARIVLAEAHGLTPGFLAEDPPAVAGTAAGTAMRQHGGRAVVGLDPGEAAVVIGGPALRLSAAGPSGREPLHLLDLGTAWRELTGLPLVVGLWLVRADAALPDLSFYFKTSLRYGLGSLSAIARESAAELGLDSGEIERFLRETVSFVLRDEERRSIDELLRRAASHGLVPEGAAVRFLPS
jgi:chorismate dehydratase